jgi:Lipid A 3-O-deacylase (PagL)
VELVAVEPRCGILRDQFPDLFLTFGRHDAHAKGTGRIEHGPEDDDSSLLHEFSPKGGVLLHDGPFIIGHVQGEGGPGRVQFEKEVLFHRMILSRHRRAVGQVGGYLSAAEMDWPAFRMLYSLGMMRRRSALAQSEVSCLPKAALLTIFTVLVGASGRAQEPGGFGEVQSFGFSSSYSADSSHILLGDAEQRRIWTLGVEHTRLLRLGQRFRLDYEGSVLPLYEETDPTLTGTMFTLNGQTVTTVESPVRVTYVNKGPLDTLVLGNSSGIPIYGVFGRQDTYAAAISPLGARISAVPRWRVQPRFALNLGFVVSARDLPVNRADQFNYMFSLGPGVQFFIDRKTSWRVEYIYRHTSNAGQGFQNPGVDQGVVRVTVSVHR